MAKAIIQKILADGAFHSGEELGDAAGVSRTAIWKIIKKLEGSGLQVESVRGKGYRLLSATEPLHHDVIVSEMAESSRALLAKLFCFDEVDSTNRFILSEMMKVDTSVADRQSLVCCAELQSAGKGRRGRTWVSPYGRNIYLSIGHTFKNGAKSVEALSLAVGVAVAEVLIDFGVGGVGLKWPNDILADNRKLSGILIELAGDADGVCHAVVGIGINVLMPDEVSEIDQPWTDCQSMGIKTHDRNRIVAALLDRLLVLLSSYEEQGFAAYYQQFSELDAYKGLPVYVKLGSNIELGVAAGVDASGALLMQTDHGLKAFNGGEVSLRRQDDSRV